MRETGKDLSLHVLVMSSCLTRVCGEVKNVCKDPEKSCLSPTLNTSKLLTFGRELPPCCSSQRTADVLMKLIQFTPGPPIPTRAL